MYINIVQCFSPPIQSVHPIGGMVLLPAVGRPLALMGPCRPPGRPHGHGRGWCWCWFSRLSGSLLILLWQLGGCPQVLFENFQKAPAPNFRECARTGSHHAPVARIVAAGTCADTLNLRRAIAGNRREPVLLT